MTSQPRVLLLTGSPPGDRGVGQIIVKEICRNYPHEKLFCFATMSRHETWEKPAEFSGMTVKVENKRFEHRYRPIGGPIGDAVAWAGYRGKFRPHCNKLQASAIQFGRENQCEILFSILESATNIQITDGIARGLNIPKHVLVWDAPDYIATHLSQTPLSVAKVESAFDDAIQGAKKLAVVSDPMARKYKRDYGLDSIMLRHAASPASGIARVEEERRELVIGFAGSVSAKPQLELLQQALDGLDWKISGRSVRLDLYGLRFTLQSRKPRNVLYRGYLPVSETVESLAKSADILFMPQPFEEKSRSFTELSFPTKFSTYLAASQPILLLSPKQSSLGEFFETNPFGVWCDEMDCEKLTQSLLEIAADPGVINRAKATIKNLLETQFNQCHFREQLHRFLGGDS